MQTHPFLAHYIALLAATCTSVALMRVRQHGHHSSTFLLDLRFQTALPGAPPQKVNNLPSTSIGNARASESAVVRCFLVCHCAC
jgi:hypothetical protein